MERKNREDLPPCLITIDKDGRWFHKGAEIIHRDIVRLFYENMVLDPKGRYVIDWQGQRCYVEAEDTAYVVWRVDDPCGMGRSGGDILLTLSDDSREPLAPETLGVGRDNVLYCRVKGGAFPARFSRAAYYQLAQYVEEDGSRFYLVHNGRRHPIAINPVSRKTR